MTKEKKIAVHCPTEDEWEKVQKKAFSEGLEWREEGQSLAYKANWSYILFKESETLDACTDASISLNNYAIISASDYLAYGLEGRAFKIGDEVEIAGKDVCGGYEQPVGSICVVIDNGLISPSTGIGEKGKLRTHVEGCNGNSVYWDTSLKLIESKNKTPHTIPLRVDDKVRVVKDIVYSQLEGQVGIINDLMGKHPYITGVRIGNENFAINTEGLELIPTEADITVGSVWEEYGHKKVITGIDKEGRPIVNDRLSGDRREYILENFKLIHRGDGQVAYISESKTYVEGNDLVTTLGTQKQTNKKEKKMKKAGKVIKEGMLIVDRDCSNHGKVITIHEGHDKVTYEDIDGSDVHTVRISRLYIPLEMPKPKPVKKKTKKTTKKGK